VTATLVDDLLLLFNGGGEVAVRGDADPYRLMY
jgi:hypothetical protein